MDDTSVFDEIRAERSGQSLGRALLLRALGLGVIALAVFIIARNVSWTDTLVLETAQGKAVLPGTIIGDWRSTEVQFQVDSPKESGEGSEPATVDLPALGLEAGTEGALMESIQLERPFRVREGVLMLPGGRPALVTEKGRLAEAARGPDKVQGIIGTEDDASMIEWRPGMLRTMAEIDLLQLMPAVLLLILASLCVVTRWWRILKLNDCPTSWYNAFRYTYSGLFFNAVAPGNNGGDVARAVAVVRQHPNRRAEAFMTVVVDRVMGLAGMILLGTALVLSTDERLSDLRMPVALFSSAVVVGGILFFLPSFRRLVRFDSILQKLPQSERLRRLDDSARKLLSHPGEVLAGLGLSLANHVLNGFAVFTAASALGSDLGFHDWMTTMAISNTLAAVPISPGGLGVGEVLFGSLAEKLGSTYALGVATSLVYRLCLYAMSLLGGLVMLLPAGRASSPHVAIPEGE